MNIEHISMSTKEQSPLANICRSQNKRYNSHVEWLGVQRKKSWLFSMYSNGKTQGKLPKRAHFQGFLS